ncbi:unnamed protein product [Caenorhabditis bovis]|uniref:N-acetyltransferase domain-containing protein n=1 Tax=Caenorhabditis bovis TaxID=2654633 RepID=A0A8S1FGF4_9PELO|nr:unnamed protein product [Caenorhabditis bovis]
MPVEIVEVIPDHAPLLLQMIHELAEFEKMKDSVLNTEKQLRSDIERKAVLGFIALDGTEPAGMNLFYYAYSTWVGQYIHMEDLYVRPIYRRQGIARKLWKTLAVLAKNNGNQRIEWAVLDWNKGAIALYDTVNYTNLTKNQGWYTFRMDREAIEKLANEN